MWNNIEFHQKQHLKFLFSIKWKREERQGIRYSIWIAWQFLDSPNERQRGERRKTNDTVLVFFTGIWSIHKMLIMIYGCRYEYYTQCAREPTKHINLDHWAKSERLWMVFLFIFYCAMLRCQPPGNHLQLCDLWSTVYIVNESLKKCLWIV